MKSPHLKLSKKIVPSLVLVFDIDPQPLTRALSSTLGAGSIKISYYCCCKSVISVQDDDDTQDSGNTKKRQERYEVVFYLLPWEHKCAFFNFVFLRQSAWTRL